MKNKNKITQIESEIEDSSEKLLGTMDLLGAAITDMKKSFLNIFYVSKKDTNFITPDMEKFEKNWLNLKNK